MLCIDMVDNLIPGASEIAALVRSKDWARHRLGPIGTWPACLRTALTTCFAARSPMQLWWGAPAFTFYNDAFVPWIGAQHPDALGRRAADIYGARWQVRQSAVQRVYVENRTVEADGLVMMPLFDGGNIEGVLSTFAQDRVGSDLMWAVDEAVRGPLHELARHSPADEHVLDLMRGVDNLLDITRLARGKLLLDRESADLQTIIGEVLATVGSRASARKVTIEYGAGTSRLLAATDRKRLSRALQQMLVHAIDSSSGSIIRMSVDRTDDVLSIRIEHAGSELPMLVRLPAQRIIELHDGTIVDRKVNASREITIGIPAAEKVAVDGNVRPARILIVEDDDTSARTTQLTLEHFGYLVEVAHDGAVALEIAREFHPDIAVVDLGLPVIDGWEVARRLREKHAGLSVVAMTGWGGEEERQRSARAGFVEHFCKPVDFDSLHRCLSALPRL